MIPSWSELTSIDAELKYLGWQRMLRTGYHDHFTYDAKTQSVKRVRVFIGTHDGDPKPTEEHTGVMPTPSVNYRLDGDAVRDRFWERYASQRTVVMHLMARYHRPEFVLLNYCKEQYSDVPDAELEAMVHCMAIGDLTLLRQTKKDLLERVAQDYRTLGYDGMLAYDIGPAPEGKGDDFVDWLVPTGATGVPQGHNWPLVLHTPKHPLPEVVLQVKHAKKWCSVRTLSGTRRFLMEDTEQLERLGLLEEQPLLLSKMEIATLGLVLFLEDYADEDERPVPVFKDQEGCLVENENYDADGHVDLGIEPSWAEQLEREFERVQAQVDIRRNDITDFLPEEKYWEASPDDDEDNLVNLSGAMGKRPMGKQERGRDLDPEFRIGMTWMDLVALEGDPADSHFAKEEVIDFVRQRKKIEGVQVTYPNKEYLPKDKRKAWLGEVEAAIRGSLAFGGKVRLFHLTSPVGDRWAKMRYFENGEPVPGRAVGDRVWQICGSCDRQDLPENEDIRDDTGKLVVHGTRQYHRQSQKYESLFTLDVHRDVCLNCGSDKQVVVALAYVPAAHLSHLFDFPVEPYPARHYLKVEIYGQYVQYLMQRRYEVKKTHTHSIVETREAVFHHKAVPARGYAPKFTEDGGIFMMHPQAWNEENQDSQLLSYEHKMHGFEVVPTLMDDGYHIALITDYGTWVHDHAFPEFEELVHVPELINWDWIIKDEPAEVDPNYWGYAAEPTDFVHLPYVYVEREESFEWKTCDGLKKAHAFAAKVRTALRTHQITLANISKRKTVEGKRCWVDVSPHWARRS